MKHITKNEKIAKLQNKNKEIFDELKSITRQIKSNDKMLELEERYRKGETDLANEEGNDWLKNIDVRITYTNISYDENIKLKFLKKILIMKSQRNLAKIAKLNSQNVR